MAIGPAGSSRTQSDRRRLGSVTLARSRVRVRAGYEFVSCRRHGDQRLPAGPIATSFSYTCTYMHLLVIHPKSRQNSLHTVMDLSLPIYLRQYGV